jgi:hypothetical protein
VEQQVFRFGTIAESSFFNPTDNQQVANMAYGLPKRTQVQSALED